MILPWSSWKYLYAIFFKLLVYHNCNISGNIAWHEWKYNVEFWIEPMYPYEMNFQKILQTREIINIHTAESITRTKTFCHPFNVKFSLCDEHGSEYRLRSCRCKVEKITCARTKKVTCIDLNIVKRFDTPLGYYYRNDSRKMQHWVSYRPVKGKIHGNLFDHKQTLGYTGHWAVLSERRSNTVNTCAHI